MSLRSQLAGVRAVPVLRSSSAAEAVAVGRSLADGGLTVIELTFSTPDVVQAISTLAETPGVVVGAGTVTTAQQAEDAVRAGARFLVSPVWLPWLPALAADLGVDAIPGAATPSEIWQAHSSGCAAVKVFPVARLGGAAYIRDILAPLPELTLMATGGADITMAKQLIDAGCLAVGLGSVHSDTTLGDTVEERARAAHRALAATA